MKNGNKFFFIEKTDISTHIKKKKFAIDDFVLTILNGSMCKTYSILCNGISSLCWCSIVSTVAITTPTSRSLIGVLDLMSTLITRYVQHDMPINTSGSLITSVSIITVTILLTLGEHMATLSRSMLPSWVVSIVTGSYLPLIYNILNFTMYLIQLQFLLTISFHRSYQKLRNYLGSAPSRKITTLKAPTS